MKTRIEELKREIEKLTAEDERLYARVLITEAEHQNALRAWSPVECDLRKAKQTLEIMEEMEEV